MNYDAAVGCCRIVVVVVAVDAARCCCCSDTIVSYRCRWDLVVLADAVVAAAAAESYHYSEHCFGRLYWSLHPTVIDSCRYMCLVAASTHRPCPLIAYHNSTAVASCNSDNNWNYCCIGALRNVDYGADGGGDCYRSSMLSHSDFA